MKNKQRSILIDVNPLVNGKKSGVGHFTQRFLEAVAQNNSSSIVITAYYFNFLGRKKDFILPKLPTVTYKEIRFFPSKLLAVFHRLGLQLPIELFVGLKHFDYMIFPNFVALPSLRKTPFAVMVHDMSFIDHPNYLTSGNLRFLRRFVPLSVKRAALVVTISEFTKQRLAHHYGKAVADKTMILPIPYEAPKYTTERKISKAVAEIITKPYVLFVGTIEPRKNIENLIYGFAALPSSIRKKYQLVLAGSMGWKTEKIKQAISATKQDINVVLTGYLDDHERDTLYQHATSVCLVSHYEGFGMPVLEAMHYKKPLVLSDIAVFREVAGEYALYCEKDNPADIARVIETSLTHKPQAVKLAYDWAKNARRFIDRLNA